MATQNGRNIVGACEAKTHLSELLEQVEAGEEITIDAMYLDLAVRSNLPLATLDDDLRAKKLGVSLLS